MNLINKNDLFDNSFLKVNDLFKADICEVGNQYKIILDLPGFKKENISIDYSNGYLNIVASKQNEINDETTFLHRERFYGEYKRTFYIGCVVESSIEAKYENGIITIILEKQNDNNRKKNIKIK